MKLSDLKRQYLEYIEIEKGRSLKTVVNYTKYIDTFITFTKDIDVESITDNLFREYRLFLNRQPAGKKDGRIETLKKRTQNYYLIALRSFLKYANRIGL